MASSKEYEMLFSLNAKLGGSFQSAFNNAKNSLVGMQNQINALNKTQGDISAYQKQQAAVERTKEKLGLLQKQYANLKTETDNAGTATAAMKNKMLDKERQIDKTTASLKAQEDKLNTLGNSLNDAGVDTSNLADESRRLASETDNLKAEQEAAAQAAQEMGEETSDAVSEIQQAVAAAGLVELYKQLYEGMKACTESSIEFESAMTGVDKTTDMSNSELELMGEEYKELSTQIPAAAKELAGIGEVAGQLGIKKGNIIEFSTVMAQLATATTMTSEEAATMLAQFANITQMNPAFYSNLASTIVDLGNNYATTEQKITDMMQGMAASASLAGMSEADIAGLSAAVASLGIESAAGSTSMSKMITEINMAVETGEGLTSFAQVANMTAEDFSRAWGQDAASALATFITGLSDTERNGRSATVILSELGITEARMQRMVLSLANSGDLMNNTLATANSAWSSNTALQNEAAKRYATTESQLTMMANAADNLKIAIGDNLTPVIQSAAPGITGMLSGFAQFIQENPALVSGFMATAGVLGVATAALTGYAAVAKIAAGASALLGASIPGLNIVLGVTAGIAGLAGVLTGLGVLANESAYNFSELDQEFDALTEQIAQQNEISDLCDEYFRLNRELSDVSGYQKQVSGLKTQGKAIDSVNSKMDSFEGHDGESVKLTAEVLEKLTANDMLEGTIVTLTAEAAALLAAEGLLDGTTVKLSAEAASKMAAAGLLENTEVGLTAAAKEKLEAEGLISSTSVGLTAEAAKKLEAAGLLEGTLVKLTPAAADFMNAEGLLTGTQVSLTATAAQKMAAAGLLDDTTVQLTPEAAKTLKADGFMESTSVDLTAQPKSGSEIEPSEFVKDGVVPIDGEANKNLSADSFVKDEAAAITGVAENKIPSTDFIDSTTDATVKAVPDLTSLIGQSEFLASEAAKITGVADISNLLDQNWFLKSEAAKVSGVANSDSLIDQNAFLMANAASITGKAENIIPASDFVSDDVALIKAQIELTNDGDINARLTTIKNQLTGAKNELADAQKELDTAQGKVNSLNESLEGTKGKKKKAKIRTELEEAETLLAARQAEVNTLTETVGALSGEYEQAETAAGKLAAKEQELATVKERLSKLSGGVINATNNETEAFNEQVEVLQNLADARKAELQVKAATSIRDQAKGYMDAVKVEQQAQGFLDDALAKQAQAQGAIAGGATAVKGKIDAIYKDLNGKFDDDAFLNSSEGMSYMNAELERAAGYMSLLSGKSDISFSLTGFTGFEKMYKDTDWGQFTPDMTGLYGELEQATGEVNDYQHSVSDAQATQNAWLDNLIIAVGSAGMEISTVEQLLNEAFGGTENGAQTVESIMSRVNQALAEGTNAAGEYAEGQSEVEQQTAAANAYVQQQCAKLDELAKKYNEAYKSAKSSIDGQFDLFEKVEEPKKKDKPTTKKMQEGLESQAEYLEEYQAALVAAQEKGVDADLLSSLSDGSVESKAALEELASATPEKIAEINAAFQEVQAGKESFANTVAEIQTGLSTSMDAMVQEVQTSVGEMNLSSEAADAANKTVQGFIGAIDGKLGAVAAAAKRLSDAFINSFNVPFVFGSPSKLFKQYGSWVVEGFASGVETKSLYAENEMAALSHDTINAFTAQQNQAVPAEAMYFGAEDLNSGTAYRISIAPVYNISGSDSEGVKKVLREHDEELRDMVNEILDERAVDAGRTSYK